jgi:hypothetical protein
MRSRPVVFSACLLALTIGVVLAGVTAGSARQSVPRPAICPQSAQLVTTTPCCGPPIDVDSSNCCPISAAACPRAGLTLSASSDPAAAGTRIVLSGDLAAVSAVGVTIKLWQRLPSASGFSQTLTTTTKSGGGFSFTLAKGSVMTDRSWYVTGDGLTSSTVHENVSAVLTLASSKSHGRTVLRGKVTPAQKGHVTIERLVAKGRWKSLARVSLGHGSTFRWRAGYVARGTATVRAMVPANTDHIASFSRSLRAFVLRK